MTPNDVLIFRSLEQFINSFRLPYDQWYVGVTNDWKRRLFDEHRVSRLGSDYKVFECSNAEAATHIEKYFCERMRTDGGTGGAGADARYVYLYLKHDYTINC